jgi:CRISPR/Cas system CSM-associated protein Csm4 (group 5 of RAMP superfamily)
MQVKTIIKEIERLPLQERFFVMEQTLESIKKEELKHSQKNSTSAFSSLLVNEKSLEKDWLSDEDSRWDSLLQSHV